MKPQNAVRLAPDEAFGKNIGNFHRETNTALWEAGECGPFFFFLVWYAFVQDVQKSFLFFV